MQDLDAQPSAELATLIEISRQLAATTELVPLLKSIEQAALKVLNCERATVFLYDPATNELYSKVATGVDEIRFPADKGIAGEVAQTRKTINVPDAYSDQRFNSAVDKVTGFKTRNILAVSMVGYNGDLVGVLQLLNKKANQFEDRDASLASSLSDLAGVALQRQFLLEEYAEKQRIERDLDLAREIQRACLPQSAPDLAGYDVAGWNKPADQTGGDAFDFIPSLDHKLGLLIADATGHGVGPALMVSECRALVRVLAAITDDLPQILTKANSVLHNDLQEGRFVTACFAFLDPDKHGIRFLSAGHGPQLHYIAAEDRFVELPANTVPMGILDEFPMLEHTEVDLAPGDLFILITDGFHEWTSTAGEQFGMNRMFEVLRSTKDQPCADMITALHEAVCRFGEGTPQGDDLTAIMVKRTG